MTIAQALASVQNRSVSYREAEIFLAAVLQVTRAYLFAHPEQRLKTSQRQLFGRYIKRREKNEPVAYILGQKEFYGRPFVVDRRALIPRPETEGLIDDAVSYATDYFHTHLASQNKPCPLHILELGTGCGNIAISVAIELSQRNVPVSLLATDLSPQALELAQLNQQQLIPTPPRSLKLQFCQADLFANPLIKKQSPFVLILANLPYVESSWAQNPAAQADVIFYEPDLALFGGSDGLQIYQQFFAEVKPFLADDGAIMIEHGEKQTAAIHQLVQTHLGVQPITKKDGSGLDRITIIQIPALPQV